MTLLDIVLVCAYGLTLLSIVAVLFLERKDPSTTLVWILVLSFLPVIGVVLYLFLGRGLKVTARKRMRLRAEMREKYRQLPDHMLQTYEDTAAIAQGKNFAFNDPASGERFRDNIILNARLADAAFTQDNGLALYTDTREHYDAMFEEIRGAKESVHVMYFIIARDATGKAFVELLAQKAREGVSVRLIYDEVGSITTPHSMFRPLSRAGGTVHRFFPLRMFGVLRANYRNHHKIVVIDNKVAYMGGINIGNNYLGLHRRITPWRDTHMRLTGCAVSALQHLFLMDLYYAANDEKLLEGLLRRYSRHQNGEGGTIGMQIVASGPDAPEEAIKRSLCHLISSARESVLIQSPYLMPDAAVQEALQNAAAAGVKVRFMLPGIPDKRAVYVVTNSYIGSLLDYGVEVYKHRGFLHAKMVVVDGRVASIGTCNMDMRSFSLHFEVNAFIYDSAVARRCEEIFRQDLGDCKQVTRQEYEARGFLQKLNEGLLRVLAPLM